MRAHAQNTNAARALLVAQPFRGYREHLRPHLDTDYLKLHNQSDPDMPRSKL